MASKKSRIVLGVISILIFAVALTFMILDWTLPLNFLTHPILNLLGILFTGFGIMAFVLAFTNKSVWFLFVGAIALGLVLLYVLLNCVVWWIAIICLIVFWCMCAVLSITVFGNRTENIALNKSPDYKTYEERKAEKAEAEKKQPEEELPTIKSFKE